MLTSSKIVNLLPIVVSVRTVTTRTISAFDVLDGIRTGTEPTVTTDGTSNISRTMNLQMHIQLVLVVKFTITLSALKDGNWSDILVTATVLVVDAVPAPAVSVAFRPLVAAKLTTGCPITALGTISSHYLSSLLVVCLE